MFKKLEAWLRKIIAEEVKAVEGKLDNERSKIISAISVHTKATTNGIEREVYHLLGEFEGKLRADAAEVIAEKNQLIAELKATIAGPSRWTADPDVVAADHELRNAR